MEHRRRGRPADRRATRTAPTRPGRSSTASRPTKRASSRHRDDPLPEELPALRGPAVRPGLPDRRELQEEERRHRPGRLRQVHRLQVLRMGVPVRRARDRRGAPGDDQVHALRRPHRGRVAGGRGRKPACVKACPTGARLFGDVKDPESEVSRAIRERGGYSLMPEWRTRPANQYLPRRITAVAGASTHADGRDAAIRARRPWRRRRSGIHRAAPMNPAFSVVVFTTAAGAGQGSSSLSPIALLTGVPMAPSFVRASRWSRSCCSSSAWRRRSFTSAGRCARGGPRRCGAPRGCRAR